jgi:hypothetical protein
MDVHGMREVDHLHVRGSRIKAKSARGRLLRR